MSEKYYYVYIMGSKSGTLYIGVTNNIYRRIYEHKNGIIPGFSKRYNCVKLLYLEQTEDISAAISREKQLKGWIRKKKESLIKEMNPAWKDLSLEWDMNM